jgi:hypothetical protein
MLILPRLLLEDRIYAGGTYRHREILPKYYKMLLGYCQDNKFGIAEIAARKDAMGMGARIVEILRETTGSNQTIYRFIRRQNTAWKDVLLQLQTHDPAVEIERAFLWSIVESEAQFLKNFLNFESHEERVTGTLLSTLVLTIESYGALFHESTGTYSGPTMALFDTATHSNERLTGSDFGVIVRSRSVGTTSLVKAARIQVKNSKNLKVKISNTERRSDIDQGIPQPSLKYQQLQSLCSPAGIGYYCAIERSTLDEFSLSPIVFSAKSAETKLKKTGRDTIDIASDLNPLPLFAFLAIGMTSDESRSCGVTIDGADDELQMAAAVQTLFGGQATPPRYCLYVDVTSNSLTPVFRRQLAHSLRMKPQPRGNQSDLQLRNKL